MAESSDQRRRNAQDAVGRNDDEAEQYATSRQCDDKNIPWRLVFVVLIGALLLLVGLPVGAVWIANSSGCCFAGGPENVITFWASMIAGFLTLFGMVVTGVFILTAFKTKEIAEAEAGRAATKVAKKEARVVAKDEAAIVGREAAQETASAEAAAYLQRHKGEIFEKLEATVKEVAQRASERSQEIDDVVAEIKREMASIQREATEAMAAAREATAAAANEAQEAMSAARGQTTNAANEAQEAIDRARERIVTAANEARGAMEGASQDVERQRTEAIRVIDDARQEAEAAAREVREIADRARGGPAQDSDEPRQSDE